MTEKVRIKKGVRPYGGRLLRVVRREVYPNGRKTVVVLAPNSHWERMTGVTMNPYDEREYDEDEVEEK